MRILGIDYGKSKVGIAVADGPLAEPVKVIRYKRSLASQSPGKDIKILSEEILKIIEKEEVGKVVVGVSEGEMGRESKQFALDLSLLTSAIVETYDETLTSHDAQALSMEAGIGRKKRHEMEDAYAAAIMLQNYIDNN